MPVAALANGTPAIDSESVSKITPTDATLEAKINTEGLQYGAWTQFQLVANPSKYPAEFDCPPEDKNSSLCLKLPEHSGTLPLRLAEADSPNQSVSLELAKAGLTLKPDTTYHYRVIAASKVLTEDFIDWEPPIVYGPDQTFTTPAAPRWFLNGNLAGASGQSIVQLGTITLENKLLGEIKCKVIAGLKAGNESEKGVAAVEGWEAYDCSAPECPGRVLLTPEEVPEKGKEKETPGARQPRSLPWPAELISSEAGKAALNLRKMKLWIVCPRELLEVPFTGNLEPRLQNGLGNGLSPSHLLFEGKGGHTGFLISPDIAGGAEVEESELFFSGELTTIGTSQELITAE